MGRRRFRLADMMPNSWFYKLRGMRRARGHAGGAASAMPPPPSPSPRTARAASSPRRGPAALPHRTSDYYPTRDRELPAPRPRPAADTEEDRELPHLESPHTYCPSSAGLEALGAVVRDAPQRRRDMYVGRDGSDDDDEVRRPTVTAPSEDSLSGGGKVIASDTDIVFDLRGEGTAERVLRSIVTKPARREVVRYELKDWHVDGGEATPRASSASEQGSRGHPRRSSVSTGCRLRTRDNTPRLASARSRKSKPATPPASLRKTPAPPPPLAESFAVVKASADPRRDFRESMEEMIAEKGIRDAADLEDLLACYLALNAAEHHDLIVEVFEQIWAGLAAGAYP